MKNYRVSLRRERLGTPSTVTYYHGNSSNSRRIPEPFENHDVYNTGKERCELK